MSQRNVKFAYVNISDPATKQNVAMRYTPFGRNGQKMYTPTIMIYGRDKSQPEQYTKSKFAFKLNEYLESYCDKYGYGKTLGRNNQSYFSKPKPAHTQHNGHRQ